MVKLLMVTGLVVLAGAAGTTRAADTGGWQFQTVRPEAAPASATRDNTLVISGTGDTITDGKWVKRVPIPADARFLKFTAQFKVANVEMLARNVVASVVWLDEAGNEAGHAEFARTTAPADAAGWRKIDETYKVPAKARHARIELRLRWSPKGEVEWKGAELKPAAAPAARVVKVASVNHRPRGLASARANLESFAKWVDEAGKKKADIVCLPEAITLIGRGADYLANVEPIPGPSTGFLGDLAKRNNTYIVAGLLEKDGKAAHNTSVLIDRQGNLVGKYRKICLPRGEIDGGLAPGSEYPVFQTDFGKVGMMICWDVSYPEIARELTAAGAEMILMPIWGGNETLCRARAIENQVPLVISSYDLRSAIYNPGGEPQAAAPDTSSMVVMADVELGKPMEWKWMGNWKSRIWLEGPVRKDPAPPADAPVAKAQAD